MLLGLYMCGVPVCCTRAARASALPQAKLKF